MNRHKRACFTCRISVKGGPLCPRCGVCMEPMGYKVPIPRQTDTKGWRLLQAGRFIVRRGTKFVSPKFKLTMLQVRLGRKYGGKPKDDYGYGT